jgi:hypothetical protein
MKSDLKSQIFVAVSAAITQKYPTQSSIDYTYIADTALKLTNTLYDKYNEENAIKPQLLTEKTTQAFIDEVEWT